MRTSGKKNSGSFSKSAALGVAVSSVISLMLSAVLALLVSKERVDATKVDNSMPFISAISVLIGGVIAGKKWDEKLALLIGAVGLIYLFLLSGAGVLIFDGGFHNLGLRLLAVVVGSGISCAICIRGKGTKGKRKRAYR